MSDFMTDEEIYEEMTTIAAEQGYSSEVIDILCKLMSYGVYAQNFMTLNILRESSLLTATKIDSILTLAHNNFYSVPRGTCQRLLINNVFPIKPLKVSKFELISTIGSHSLFHARDYEYIIQTIPSSVETIVGSSLYETSFKTTGLFYDILEPDLTEDILFTKMTENGEEEIVRYDSLSDFPYEGYEDKGLVYTTEAKDWTVATRPFLVMTLPGYGIRIYNNAGFNILDEYRFKCIKLSKQESGDKSPSDIRKLPGFTFENNILDSFENTPTEYPEGDINKIVSDTIANYVSAGKLVSYNDIENFIRIDFPEFLGYYVSYIKSKVDTEVDKIIVYYHQIENDGIVDTLKVERFKKRLKGYNVPDEIQFEIVSKKKVRLDIIIITETDVLKSEIETIIKSYQDKVGIPYFIDDLKADIVRVEGVAFCETNYGPDTILRYDDLVDGIVYNDYRTIVAPNERIVFGSGSDEYRVVYKTLSSTMLGTVGPVTDEDNNDDSNDDCNTGTDGDGDGIIDGEELITVEEFKKFKKEIAEKETGSIVHYGFDSVIPKYTYKMDGTTVLNAAEHPLLAERYPEWVDNNNLVIPDWGDSVLIATGSNDEFDFHNNIQVGGTQQTRGRNITAGSPLGSTKAWWAEPHCQVGDSNGAVTTTYAQAGTVQSGIGSPLKIIFWDFDASRSNNPYPIGETNSNNGKGVMRCIVSYPLSYYE